MYNFIKTITEGKRQKLVQIKLPFNKAELGRSLSKQTIDYHFGKLYKAYVDRFNKGEGDPDFNEAGAFLHSIYFNQFTKPKGVNPPTGSAKDFIEKHFTSFEKFKKDFTKTAMGIQGSGWVYLSTDGRIKTIVNHQIQKDILLLIDWWEHAWALDFQADKEGYLNGQWRIINWETISNILDNK